MPLPASAAGTSRASIDSRLSRERRAVADADTWGKRFHHRRSQVITVKSSRGGAPRTEPSRGGHGRGANMWVSLPAPKAQHPDENCSRPCARSLRPARTEVGEPESKPRSIGQAEGVFD